MTPPLQIRRNAAKLSAVALAAVTAVVLAVGPAGADQLTNARSEAQYLNYKIGLLGQQEAALGEQYDAGVLALGQANGRVVAASGALAKAKLNQAKTVVLLRADAVDAYVGGGPQVELAGSVPLSNLNEALLRQELEETFASDQTDVLDSYRLAAANESTAEAQFVVARNMDAKRLAGLKKDRQQVQAAEENLIVLQQQVKGQIATLVAQIRQEQILAEQRAEAARLAQQRAEAAAAAAAQVAAQQAAARQAAQQAAAEEAAQQAAARQAAAQEAAQQQAAQEAARQASAIQEAAKQVASQEARQAASLQAVTTTVPSETGDLASSSATTTLPVATTVPATTILGPAATTTVPSATYGAPGVSSAAAIAVQAAESRVGDPYVWGAAGPDEFDCSGLVMWAYEQAGVDLPHYSGSQFADTTEIPMSDLEPGDLVFPSDPGEHVAMYIGNGEIVQAPYTGADVQIVPLTGWFVLASRVG